MPRSCWTRFNLIFELKSSADRSTLRSHSCDNAILLNDGKSYLHK